MPLLTALVKIAYLLERVCVCVLFFTADSGALSIQGTASAF